MEAVRNVTRKNEGDNMGKKKNNFRKGFRKNKTTKHPAYVYAKGNNKIQYVSLTHSDNYDNETLIPLHKNPDPNDKEKAYILPNPYESSSNSFSRRYNWKIHAKDKSKFDSVMKKPVKKK